MFSVILQFLSLVIRKRITYLILIGIILLAFKYYNYKLDSLEKENRLLKERIVNLLVTISKLNSTLHTYKKEYSICQIQKQDLEKANIKLLAKIKYLQESQLKTNVYINALKKQLQQKPKVIVREKVIYKIINQTNTKYPKELYHICLLLYKKDTQLFSSILNIMSWNFTLQYFNDKK